jgi:hypothetical protein|tara:strand:+ start:506 stop:2275 length:1770 start_codon:yes stop_codon:yes gene_type:complete
MGSSQSPADRIRRKKQREQDARDKADRAIRRANALAGNPDPDYLHEFPDLYDADGNKVLAGTARDPLASSRPSFDDPQTEDSTGTPGTPGNQGGAVPPTQGDPSNDPSNNARDRAIRRANALAGNPDLAYQSEFPDLYDADGNKVSATGTGATGDGGYESGDVTSLTPSQHLKYLKWMSEHPGDWRRASQALGFDTRQAQAQAPGPNKGAGELLSIYFGEAGRDPADLAAALIIDRDRDSWEQDLKAAATAAGSGYDSSDLDGIIRNFSYADNAGKDPQDFIDNAIETYRMRGQSGGDRAAGGYNTLWADEDPSRYSVQPTDDALGIGGPDPSADHAAELERLQKLQYALSDEERSTRGPAWTAIQAQIEAMYGGAYDTAQAAKKSAADQQAAADSAAAGAANTLTPTTNSQTMANMLPTQKVPYSARAIQGTGALPPVTAVVPVGQSSTAATIPAGTIADMTNRTNEDPYTDTSWNNTNNNYSQSLNGTGFSPSPWGGRRGLQRTGFDNNGRARVGGNLGGPTERREGRFGRRELRNNQYNADLGQQDFDGQMGNWLRAYDAWRKKGPQGGRIIPLEQDYDPNNPGVV